MTTKKTKKVPNWMKSKTGSSLHFPTEDAHSVKQSLEAMFDRWVKLPEEWMDNTHILQAIEDGKNDKNKGVEIVQSELAPFPPVEVPSDLKAPDREFIKALAYGEYSQLFKDRFADWKNPSVAFGSVIRQNELANRIKPLLHTLILIEKELRDREDVIADAQSVIDFIDNQGWNDIKTRTRK